jgi:hypothetical protein
VTKTKVSDAQDYLSKLIDYNSAPKRLIYQHRARKLVEEFQTAVNDLLQVAQWLDADGNEPSPEMMEAIDNLVDMFAGREYRHLARMRFLEALEHALMFRRAAFALRISARMFLGAPTPEGRRRMEEEGVPATFLAPTKEEVCLLVHRM